jgi:hypothetical protein
MTPAGMGDDTHPRAMVSTLRGNDDIRPTRNSPQAAAPVFTALIWRIRFADVECIAL